MNINSYAYAEVLEVLDNMEKEYVEMIPQSFINYLKENSIKEYKKHITLDKPLENQNLNSKTLSILAAINLKYWVVSEEHKRKLLNKYKENDIKKKEKLKEKVDIENILETAKKMEKKEEINVNNLPVKRKTFFEKIMFFLKK